MGRLTRGAPNSLLGLSLLACFGCGGGTTAIQEPPPPPQPDFTIGFASNSVNVHQGATSSAVNLSISPLNGFTGPVQVTLSGLPNGVNSNPPSPFDVAAGTSTQVSFSAAENTATGSFEIIAVGSSGSLSHPANLSLKIQTGAATNLPRTTFARTDSTPQMDDPSNEPRHRCLAYDPAHQLLFAASTPSAKYPICGSRAYARKSKSPTPQSFSSA